MKMINYVQFYDETKYIKDFINLPHKIYSKNNTENSKEIRKILEGKHPLRKYFKMVKFLIYKDNIAVREICYYNISK